MKKAINILIGYLTCTDPIIKNKWNDLLASFWHKDQGNIVYNINKDNNGDVTITLINSNGDQVSTVIEKTQLPQNQDISFINGLQDILNNKVDKIPGKGLSTHDFTTAFRDKLNNLQNYQHPDTHAISEIDGLPEALDAKVDSEQGKGLSTNDFTNSHKNLLDTILSKVMLIIEGMLVKKHTNPDPNFNAIEVGDFIKGFPDPTQPDREIEGVVTALPWNAYDAATDTWTNLNIFRDTELDI